MEIIPSISRVIDGRESVFLTDNNGNNRVVGTKITGRIIINITDEFGQPTNGNNIKVFCKLVYDGVATDAFGVDIAGQSAVIFNGTIQQIPAKFSDDDDGFLPFYVDGILTGNTQQGTPAAPPVCDAVINYVDVGKESYAGANDAPAYIQAKSSYYPLEYAIDNGPYQTGNAFIVGAGLHTARIRDAKGCEATQNFNVALKAGILVSDPSVTVNGKVSRWSAAFNPVVFTYQRKDFDVLSIQQDTETLKPAIVVNAYLDTLLNIGDYIYLNAGNVNGFSPYQGAYKVLSYSSSGRIVIDTDYVAPGDIVGFANINALRPYYKVTTVIKYVNPLTGRYDTIKSINRPDKTGLVKSDISSFLQSILRATGDKSNYTVVNYRDTNLAASYQVSYAEEWEGNAPAYININTPYYVTYAAKQLNSAGGGNMYEHVTQPGGVAPAKWLSDFKEPVYTAGFPFDLPFIYSEQIAGRQVYYNIETLDINRQPIAANVITGFLLNENASYLLNQDNSKFVISRQEIAVNAPIVEHVGLNRLLINAEFPSTVYYIKIQIFYDDPAPVAVTEAITVRIDKVCPKNPVYMRWLGLNGGYNYYRFNYSQDVSLDVQNATIIKNYVSDWANSEGIEKVLSKEAGLKVQVKADALSVEDIKGLQSLKYSPAVQVFTAGKWLTVVLNTATFAEYDTQNGQNEFAVTYNLPSLNIQNQ